MCPPVYTVRNNMSRTLQLVVLVLHGFISLSAASQDSCNTYVPLGSSFNVPLSNNNIEDNEITWKHNGMIVLKRKNGIYKPGKKEDISATGSLLLKDLKFENEGLYEAEVFNKEGIRIETTSYRLCVQASQEPCDKYVPLGSSFSVPLSNNNIEDNEITWKHNGIIVLKRKNGIYKPGKKEDISATGSLLLKDLKFENEGLYEAEVFNKEGISFQTASYRLCVQASQEPCDKYVPLGSSFSVPLSNNNIEDNEITWKHNGIIVLKRKNGIYKPGKKEDISATGSLQLKDLKFENEGLYEAEVFNKEGISFQTASYRLCVQASQEPCDLYSLLGSPVNVPLTIDNLEEDNEITWKHNGIIVLKRKNGIYKPGKKEDISATGSLQLKDLKFENEGLYEAEVFNKEGISFQTASYRLCVQASQEPCDLYSLLGSPVNVPLTIDNLEEDNEITWKHNGIIVLKKKNGISKPVKEVTISATGSLLLKDLKFENEGLYEAEVFNKEGIRIETTSYRLCVQASQEPCDLYGLLGSPVNVPLTIDNLEEDNEITWKHNGIIVLKKKNRVSKPVKEVTISATGSLQLKDLKFENEGLYEAEVFNKEGIRIETTPYRLCVQEKVSKPTVMFQCSTEKVTLTCNITDTNIKSFKWFKNQSPEKSKDKTYVINVKQLKESDIFTCTVENHVSNKTSDGKSKTCKESNSTFPKKLFGFDFWTMVGILAGGGGLVLLLIIITLVCCCRRQRQRRFEEEREMRLDLLTQTQPPCHPDGQKQRPRPTGGAPPGSTGPRRTPRARERPPPTPKDDDYEEQAPPLPQPRKKGPRPIKQ
ncbi:uncharacterized protein LOC105019851 isoform X2 [Esox lucius]|uniref:uncharacterized protein LOC105019851 isoform X2 n=1 Tax=Esox lucius TaxID=8010 RepID=UPI001476CDCB|nr:uncharacterized protein LOC105019851 isoform X2 [Esox lucius]